MIPLPEFVLMVLAAWRITYALVWEDGPFEVLAMLRRLPYPVGPKRVKEMRLHVGMLDCVYCTSIWVMLLLWLAWVLLPVPFYTIIIVFGGSAAVMWLEDAFDKLNGTQDIDTTLGVTPQTPPTNWKDAL